MPIVRPSEPRNFVPFPGPHKNNASCTPPQPRRRASFVRRIGAAARSWHVLVERFEARPFMPTEDDHDKNAGEKSQRQTEPADLRAARTALTRGIRWARAQELGLIFILLLLATLGWSAIEITSQVVEGETRALDKQLLLALRAPDDVSEPIGPDWVEEIARDITALGGVGVLSLLTLFVAGYLRMRGARRTFWFLLVSVVGALAMSTLLKNLINRPRPDLVPHGSFVYTASFPSGHSMMAAGTYLTLALLLMQVDSHKRAGAYFVSVALLLTVLVGVSRVYLGVHWPSDVLAGWCFGALWSLLCWTVARTLRKMGTLEAAQTKHDHP